VRDLLPRAARIAGVRSAVLVAALLAAGCGASKGLAPARFSAGPGWHVGESRARACPGVVRSRCAYVTSWAATAPWRDCSDCAGADGTLKQIGADGVVIFLSLSREHFRFPNTLRWPPRLTVRNVVSPVEGHAPRFGLYSRGGRLHGLSAGLYVWFGRPHPTARQLARGQAELSSAHLP
jgi:hypothetical protein